MRSSLTLLYYGLEQYHIELPRKRFTTTAGFMRWGKNNRYWAVETGEGYTFGDYATGFKASVFPKDESSLSYLERLQRAQAIKEAQRMEEKTLPKDIDYANIDGLRIEARQKLDEVKPLTLAQASRISGVTPADITVLILYLRKNKL